MDVKGDEVGTVNGMRGPVIAEIMYVSTASGTEFHGAGRVMKGQEEAWTGPQSRLNKASRGEGGREGSREVSSRKQEPGRFGGRRVRMPVAMEAAGSGEEGGESERARAGR